MNARNLTSWKPGQSGNPSGRPKGSAGFAANIREETRGGQELWEFALQVMRGQAEVKAVVAGAVVNIGPSLKERMDAMKWLADRGFGHTDPVAADEEEASQAVSRAIADAELSKLSDQELKELQKALAREEVNRLPIEELIKKATQ